MYVPSILMTAMQEKRAHSNEGLGTRQQTQRYHLSCIATGRCGTPAMVSINTNTLVADENARNH